MASLQWLVAPVSSLICKLSRSLTRVKAPIKGKRTSIRAKSAKPTTAPDTLNRSHVPSVRDDFGIASTKRDKRTIKHSTFVSKIEKRSTISKKRRRPSRKLAADLETLADALPETEKREVVLGEAKIKHRSLKSRPGAMKRKEKLEKMERERFGKNMAQLVETAVPKPAAGSTESEDAGSSKTSSWAALRGFISQTMEHNPNFGAIPGAK